MNVVRKLVEETKAILLADKATPTELELICNSIFVIGSKFSRHEQLGAKKLVKALLEKRNVTSAHALDVARLCLKVFEARAAYLQAIVDQAGVVDFFTGAHKKELELCKEGLALVQKVLAGI